MKSPAVKRIAIVALAVAVLAGAAGGTWLALRPKARPDPVAAAYVDAWRHADYPAMQRLLASQPAGFAAAHTRMLSDLGATGIQLGLGHVTAHKDHAQAPLQVTVALRGFQPWAYQATLRLLRRKGHWLVDWSPATLHPSLQAGQRFKRVRQWPARAPILARDGSSLAGEGDTVLVALAGQRLSDRAAVLSALTTVLGQQPDQVGALIDKAKATPDQLVPVVSLPLQRYVQVRPAIHDIKGLSFIHQPGRVASSIASFRALVGRVGEATAEDLKQLGAPYLAGDQAGRSGLERAFERQLAGTPSGEIDLVNPDKSVAAVLQRFPGQPGKPLQTTLDPKVQTAAESAFVGVPKNAALVALQPSTGEVRAVVNWPTSGTFDRALVGHYPPGSTFKVVTATALLSGGLKPTDPVACPPSIKVGGLEFGNFQGEATPGTVPFRTAFAISCNTAFIGQATTRLDGDQLVAAAARYGFNSPVTPGVPAASSSVPRPQGKAELANEAIGQGRVSVTPLQMATVAGAVGAGAWHPPVLVAGQQAGDPRPLDPALDAALKDFMAAVVNSGTGTAAKLPGAQVYGKTGTAEFGTVKPLHTHAWFIGFRGDLAFAVVVEDGGVGGEVAAPIAARFLKAL